MRLHSARNHAPSEYSLFKNFMCCFLAPERPAATTHVDFGDIDDDIVEKPSLELDARVEGTVSEKSYWDRTSTSSRRRMLRSVVLGGAGLAGAALIGCGDDDDAPATATAPPATSPSNGGPGGGPLHGGRIVIQPTGYASTLVLVTNRNNTTAGLAGFTHSGLLQLRNTRPVVGGSDVSVEPDLAIDMPEQPDELSYVFRIHPAKFHNGRDVTPEDVAWSLMRYAHHEDSAYRSTWNWLDTVETPDDGTIVVKTVAPYADAIGALCGYQDGFILAQEHEESDAATTQLMGSGAFLFENTEEPVISRFRRNPEYFRDSLPYVDEIHMLGTADFAKRYADFAADNVDVTYWHAAEERDQMAAARPEAHMFEHLYAGYNVFMRVDQEPFNDERVRRALSMAIDRQALRDATGAGEGEPDQAFSWTVETWGFRKPQDLGAASQYWDYDVAEAKLLMDAAGLGNGFTTQMSHWDPSVIGQAYVDQAVLIQTMWQNNLGIEVQGVSLQFAQFASGPLSGNYDGTYFAPGGGGVISPAPGVAFRNGVWSPPEGVTAPTPNTGHINDPDLSAAADLQSTQLNLDDRKDTFRIMEEIMADEMYRLTTSAFTTTYFANEALQDIQMPITATNSALAGAKHWWFQQ